MGAKYHTIRLIDFMSETSAQLNDRAKLKNLSDNELQAYLLEGVSRTFALTIPQLPERLHQPIANAYLLCRIVDTIEDETSLTASQKKIFCSDFIEVVKENHQPEIFSLELSSLLSEQTIPAEHTLCHLIPRVVAITHSFDTVQKEALISCVETMALGMPKFQALDLSKGLNTLPELDDYCYHVAGCVGEMLTKLFCHYSPEINQHRDQLLKLSISFGQGLQMTNILKDIWDDADRNVCWLPQDIFDETGFELQQLSASNHNDQFQHGLAHLISIGHDHLENALTYTKLIPTHETGIRNFCLWALGMAVLNLQKIKANTDFNQSSQVKISRRSVQATILATRLTGKSNVLLTWLFKFAARGLHSNDWQYSPNATPTK
jgi:farnesyl-diphosphate farnesyltransferase